MNYCLDKKFMVLFILLSIFAPFSVNADGLGGIGLLRWVIYVFTAWILLSLMLGVVLYKKVKYSKLWISSPLISVALGISVYCIYAYIYIYMHIADSGLYPHQLEILIFPVVISLFFIAGLIVCITAYKVTNEVSLKSLITEAIFPIVLGSFYLLMIVAAYIAEK